jgi:hypothetical protein
LPPRSAGSPRIVEGRLRWASDGAGGPGAENLGDAAFTPSRGSYVEKEKEFLLMGKNVPRIMKIMVTRGQILEKKQ